MTFFLVRIYGIRQFRRELAELVNQQLSKRNQHPAPHSGIPPPKLHFHMRAMLELTTLHVKL
jgi:hypothetical protein